MRLLLFLFLLLSINFEKTTRVAIIDDFNSYHGKNVYEIIASSKKRVRIDKYFFSPETTLEEYLTLLSQVKNKKYDYLNLSLGYMPDNPNDYNREELALLKDISREGTVIAVASGNHNEDLSGFSRVYPCSFSRIVKNVYCVGAIQGEKFKETKAELSNYGLGVSIYGNGKVRDFSEIPEDLKEVSHSSFSTPRIIKGMIEEKLRLKDGVIIGDLGTFIFEGKKYYFFDE